MEENLILAGVGGQGILTIARALSQTALRRGWHIKQAEAHGMSQRGGMVQSHLRLSDRELFSDLVSLGAADMIIAVEPLEALRYFQYLKQDGVVLSSTNALVNIPSYPPLEQVLERIARIEHHILLDTDRIARLAGSARSSNIVMLGAASLFLPFDTVEIENAVGDLFAAKGARVVEANLRAFRYGLNAATAYQNGIRKGASSSAVRHWLDSLKSEELAYPDVDDVEAIEIDRVEDRLSGAEAHAVESMLERVYTGGRRQLFEHEVYTLIELIGAITPPRHAFIAKDETLTEEMLDRYPGDRVVLKIVSADIVHKTEANGIAFVQKDLGVVRREIGRMIARHENNAQVEGVLLVEYVERTLPGFGNELFVGVRATREFGPVIAAGLGGIDTEYLADKMRPGMAVAKALAQETSAEDFLDLFRRTTAYDILAGRARGHRRIVSDGELLRCFRAFISIARKFCVDRGEEGPDIAELEVNPFAFAAQRMIPLDGRGRLETAAKPRPPRPVARVANMFAPATIGVLGVSSKSMNYGRIILRNIKECGFPTESLFVIKEGEQEIDGVRCVSDLASLPTKIDLLVIAAGAKWLPDIVREVNRSGRVHSAIMIAGGAGETRGSEQIARLLRQAILEDRRRPADGTAFLGPNCMGVQSRPGHYDTFFIPPEKMDLRRDAPARRAALISQSGAFAVSLLSNLETLDPALTISIGNQIDLTLSDMLHAVGGRDDIDVIGVYAEGFANLDGLAFCRAVREVSERGKLVVFYKAGRTAPGRTAAAGHTASVAGDYDVCQDAAQQAGALVVDTFKEFEQLMELATAFHGKCARGRRIAAVTNAGFEAVGMADAVHGARYDIEMLDMSQALSDRVSHVLAQHGLEALVNPRNPIDFTSMAGEQLYEDCCRVLLKSDDVDALVVSIVPMAPTVRTTAAEIEEAGSLAERLPKLLREFDKPLIAIVDAGPLYDPFTHALRVGDVPTFRSCDQAIRSLGRYLCHRTGAQRGDARVTATEEQQSEPVASAS